jgi:diaminopimelate decarboxylase
MSPELAYRDHVLHLEEVPLPAIAHACGTPVYVYSRAHFEARFRALERALGSVPHRICYAVKANSNIAVIERFARLGAGFDIVSGGELERVLRAGGDAARIVFSGVGKSTAEIGFALRVGVGCFNCESGAELERIEREAARLGRTARIAIRVNPNIDARTHPYISTGLRENKFGVSPQLARTLMLRARESAALLPIGIGCHIGSQITDPEPLIEALDRLLELLRVLAGDGIELEHVDLGGGFGVTYRDEPEFDLDRWAGAVTRRLAGRGLDVLVEPGRYLVANGGVLLTRVEYLKPASDADGRNFAIVDAAMNDLIRPALYSAWHEVVTVTEPDPQTETTTWQIVGPVCESGDLLAQDRDLPLIGNDLLAVLSAGAYGFVQSSNYNSRDRAAEVLVDGAAFAIVRRRETLGDQLALESLPGEHAHMTADFADVSE